MNNIPQYRLQLAIPGQCHFTEAALASNFFVKCYRESQYYDLLQASVVPFLEH